MPDTVLPQPLPRAFDHLMIAQGRALRANDPTYKTREAWQQPALVGNVGARVSLRVAQGSGVMDDDDISRREDGGEVGRRVDQSAADRLPGLVLANRSPIPVSAIGNAWRQR